MARILVIIEKGENSYGAYSPDVPGCVTVGDTSSTTWSEHTRSMDCVDCIRISDALARKLPSLGTMDRLLEQMSQVASAQK